MNHSWLLCSSLCLGVRAILPSFPCHFQEIRIAPQGEETLEREVTYRYQNQSNFKVFLRFYLWLEEEEEIVYADEVNEKEEKNGVFSLFEERLKEGMILRCESFHEKESLGSVPLQIPFQEGSSILSQDEGKKEYPFTLYHPGGFWYYSYTLSYRGLDPYLWSSKPSFCIDQARFRLTMENEELPLDSSTCILKIYDQGNVFPLFYDAKEEASLFHFSFEKVDEIWWMPVLDQTLYLEKKTGLLSPTPKEGFVRTEQILFPIDLQNWVEELAFSFEIGQFANENLQAIYQGKYSYSPKEKGATYGNYYLQMEWERE